MSRENVELIRRTFAAWNERDDDAALQGTARDIVWQLRGVFPGFKPEYRGHEGVREFWSAFREPWETISVEPLGFTEIDAERVLVVARFRGKGKASGVVTEVEFPFLWTIRNGEAVRFQSFADRAEALEAAGLSE